MQAILGFQDVFQVVTMGYTKLSEKMDETHAKEVKKRDFMALFILHQLVDANNYEKISRAKTAKDACDIPEQAYASAEK